MDEKDSEGWEEVRFVTKAEGGKVCLSNGRALKKCVEGRIVSCRKYHESRPRRKSTHLNESLTKISVNSRGI